MKPGMEQLIDPKIGLIDASLVVRGANGESHAPLDLERAVEVSQRWLANYGQIGKRLPQDYEHLLADFGKLVATITLMDHRLKQAAPESDNG